MKIRLKAASRNTGYEHLIYNNNLESDNVAVLQPTFSSDINDGRRLDPQIRITFDTYELSLTGNYKAELTFSIDELYQILSEIEKDKIRRIARIGNATSNLRRTKD